MLDAKVTVIIPVYGDLHFWLPMIARAQESVLKQTYPCKLIISVSDNLRNARNQYALEDESDYLVFLDADDELKPDYIMNMLLSEGDIRVPSVHKYSDHPYPHNLRPDTDQSWYRPKDLITGNYIVVGAMIRTELFRSLGGFHDYESLEDWDLWLRAEEAGAIFTQCPGAVYKVHKRVGSRNSNKSFTEILNNAKQRRGI